MAKKKSFNVTGPCIPALHYMVDTSMMINQIISEYVDAGEYFTINRARQYGKTTTLKLLGKRLADRYIVIDMSFEGRDEYFASLYTLAEGVKRRIQDVLDRSVQSLSPIFEKSIDGEFPISDLSKRITVLCEKADKPVVLFIDEVDKASDNQVFLTFLGMLRDMYIEQASGNEKTFHSVILTGVHDIKNLKMKLRPEERHSYNSPWNIAAQFNVDMNFSALEIATMLDEYERDAHTNMDVSKVADRVFYYTSGYPFLVSLICKTIYDKGLEWSEVGVIGAVKSILYQSRDISLFQDIQKNIENHDAFKTMLMQILVECIPVTYNGLNPAIDLGIIYGVFAPFDGKVIIANKVFETFIYNYLISIASTRPIVEEFATRTKYVENGKLNMSLVLTRFAAFMKSEYRDEDGTFIERQGRLLFLSFLKPIINGSGHYVVEPETRGSRRMDIVVFYGGEESIVELKIWHGEQAANEAYDQLTGYLASQEMNEGYLVSFCDNLKSPREGKTFEHNGCTIHEVIVAYRDKE